MAEATVTTPRGFARTSLFSAAARAPAFAAAGTPVLAWVDS
jgi:hypothetical protein